ncbi:MAG: hypothetical protein WAN01_14755, partial [Bradyrhizobium sp.]
MRRLQRLIAASVLVALSTVIAGCSSNMSSFDPMDWLDWIDTKKKLPGERKPVFPDGVPGLEQGVPKSLYKGAQEGDQNAQGAVAVPPPPPPPETKPKKTAKKKPAAATASTDPAAAPEEDTTAAAPPAPKKKIVRQRTTAPPPDQPANGQQSGAQPAQPAP